MKINHKSVCLGVDRAVYEADIYDGLNAFSSDVPFYLELASKARGPVLELCCGSGRITLPLLIEGIDITGVDFTASMLVAARKKAAQHKLAGTFVRGDMRKLRLKKKFKLVFIPFNSIQNTYTLIDVEKVFATVRAHMANDGIFQFDIFNPSIEYMTRMAKLHKGRYSFCTPKGKRVIIDEICRYDSASQSNRVTWTLHIDGGKPVPQRLDMRCFYPLEMDALLKYNGFKVLHKYGSYDKQPFNSASMKQIYICCLAR